MLHILFIIIKGSEVEESTVYSLLHSRKLTFFLWGPWECCEKIRSSTELRKDKCLFPLCSVIFKSYAESLEHVKCRVQRKKHGS